MATEKEVFICICDNEALRTGNTLQEAYKSVEDVLGEYLPIEECSFYRGVKIEVEQIIRQKVETTLREKTR